MKKQAILMSAALLLTSAAATAQSLAPNAASNLEQMRYDDRVQKCLRWHVWYPGRVPDLVNALNDISAMVDVTKNPGNPAINRSGMKEQLQRKKKIDIGQYALEWCGALPDPQRPAQGGK